jgi:hypothetical protein
VTISESTRIEIAGWDVRAGTLSSVDLDPAALAAAAAQISAERAGERELTGGSGSAPGTASASPKARSAVAAARSGMPVPARHRPRAPAATHGGGTRASARDPMDPAIGKWAIVVLEADAAAAEDALAPLLARRKQQRFAHAAHLSANGKPGIIAIARPSSDNPERWREYIERAAVGRVPQYLMFVGGPDRFPFEVQARFDRDRCTGRLDVGDRPDAPLSWEACRKYADKVVAFETGHLPVEPRALLYSFGKDGPTRQSHSELVVPLRAAIESGELNGADLPASPPDVLFEADATAANLVDRLATTRPALVFTASHGLEHPPDRDLWGALTDVRYAGGANDEVVSAARIAQGAFGPGAVMFCFACFSAGVPRKSAMAFLKDSRDLDLSPEPFVPALPRALLAHERGPVAFVGHVDRATSLSFAWGKEGAAAFRDFCEWSLGGFGTLGQAMRSLRESAAAASLDLADALSPVPGGGPRGTAQQILNRWIRYHDMTRYMLLGDPVIRVLDGLQGAAP